MKEQLGISRRGLLAGAAGLGVGLGIGTPAFAYDYTSPESFDSFLQAFEDGNYHGQPTENNEDGYLAWGQAYVLLALVRMYEATKDTKYLDHFVRNTDLVLAQRDQERGVSDYRGISGPVWRALSDYTAARATLKDRNGRNLLQVRSAQSSVNDAASVEVVHSGGETDTSPFTLVLRPARGTAVTVGNVNVNLNSDRYVFKVVYSSVYKTDTRWSVRDVRPDHSTAVGLPVAGITTLQPAAYAFPVHTGNICYPIAGFIRIVYGDPALAAYRSKADAYLAEVDAAIAFHRREYWVNNVGYGAYKWIKETPVPADGSNQPQNQCNMLGATVAELYRATGSSAYAAQVGELKRGFRASFTYANDAYYWPYWGTRSAAYAGWSATGYTAQDVSSYTQTFTAAKQIEDISHAALNLEFAIAAYRTGLAAPDSSFTTTDMQRLANTYLRYIANGATGAHLNINGTGTAGPGFIDQVPRWIPVAEWNHTVFTHALAVTKAQTFLPNTGSHVLGFAYCVYGARKFGTS